MLLVCRLRDERSFVGREKEANKRKQRFVDSELARVGSGVLLFWLESLLYLDVRQSTIMSSASWCVYFRAEASSLSRAPAWTDIEPSRFLFCFVCVGWRTHAVVENATTERVCLRYRLSCVNAHGCGC